MTQQLREWFAQEIMSMTARVPQKFLDGTSEYSLKQFKIEAMKARTVAQKKQGDLIALQKAYWQIHPYYR